MDRIQRDHRYKTEKVYFNLKSNPADIKTGRVQDVSRSGAFLWGHADDSANKPVVTFKIKNQSPIQKPCRIIRSNEKENWMGIKFEEPISEYEVKKIAGNTIAPLNLLGDNITYDLAKIDRVEVFREANVIKTCASNYFIWAMGLIIPITLAVWALALEGQMNAVAISSSMIAIIIIFTVAVFSNLEKARAINKREGFIGALDYYLNKNQGPNNYRGWVDLKHCFSECGTRRRAKLCPLGIEAKGDCGCRDIGEKKSRCIVKSKRVFPSILDSFITLTSFFYAIVFFALVVLTVISFKNTWLIMYQIPETKTLIWFASGFIVSFIIWKTKIFPIGIIFGLIIGLIGGMVLPIQTSISFVSAVIGLIFGSIAWFFLRQIIALRVGHYSYETLVHTWFEILDNCIFLPNDAAGVVYQKKKIDFRDLFIKIFSLKKERKKSYHDEM